MAVHLRHFDIAYNTGYLIEDISAEFPMAVDVIPCVLTVVEMNNILVTSFVQCIYNQRVQERGVLSDNDVLI